MTKQYIVVNPFRDLQDTAKTFKDGREYKVGDEFPATKRKVPLERLEELSSDINVHGRPFIKLIESEDED